MQIFLLFEQNPIHNTRRGPSSTSTREMQDPSTSTMTGSVQNDSRQSSPMAIRLFIHLHGSDKGTDGYDYSDVCRFLARWEALFGGE